MLLELYIKNFALIDEENVVFKDGLNIITGETGSGKSIIIDALNQTLGARSDKAFIRKNKEKTIIEATYFIDNKNIVDLLLDMGIDFEIGENLVITREIFIDGKSISRVNGRSVRLSFLKEISKYLIDIHSQHDTQSIMNKDNHIKYLDLYGFKYIDECVRNYKDIYYEYSNLIKKINSLLDNKDQTQIEREIDLIKFQINEIEDANLKEGEIESLEEEKDFYRNKEKIFKSLDNAYEKLNSGSINSIDLLNNALRDMSYISSINENLENIYDKLNNLFYELDDVSKDINLYKNNMEFEQNSIDSIELRIDTINKMKRKYGKTIEEIFDYKNKIESRLEEILNKDKFIEELNLKKIKLQEELYKRGLLLEEARKKASNELKELVIKELKDLNIKSASFDVVFKRIEMPTKDGLNRIEFRASFNKGEDLKELSKIASGGELSRFMLAFKNIIAKLDDIKTLVFDEIDTGISGITAQIVGQKMKEISKEKQIICITHLPQIAVVSDTHYLIEKYESKDSTHTKIQRLSIDEKVKEVARLMSGLNITKKTLENAKEIIEISSNNN
ncbi:MAG: DNA repair protein RecN [Peptostreptococcaceae bacterium]|jgi:DNA repair protein RecN (Recombination protein N)|nr:DNA repair protein RecN [Peptostreptococcaceae bacterium]